MRRGKFIVLEGGEGVGKSTNLQFVTNWLQERSISFVQTREPGGTPLAEELRELLLRRREEVVDPVAELLMVFAARAQHLARVIVPALEQGQWVICDRFTDATYAYQGGGRQLDRALIEQLEQRVQGSLRPDKVLLLDLDPQTGLERAASTGAADRFESERLAFFQRVRAAYKERADAAPERYAVIDASRPLEQVQQQLHSELEKLLP
ncbi:dTMP kinase [Microbulbifer thermotolerans]|uniref:Thymidylate kinase n=1 Tax=Microbulbifer thermotolerans TaxID=252514 RepID=A0A143HLA6_MICTH|nr:dTMP kinase [Microbulbifer thermotolerans]AMX02499.1 dTMP kinase [Microbulbifer thermotolerans]MCX2795027.1 dTMP kinase [Microbulbifer thermotolerans]MCX2800595.1 dTMP kinase [Microbulbifer thermotolerans]MCX2833699.1 dTMP kinase [Microbulbifer thermotolerans]WKT62138.1 dTMP kinase [Microbulbifer thermotolerans]